MTINVVKDKSGKVIATYENASADGSKIEPVLQDGHKVETMEVHENYRQNLAAIYA